MCVCVCVWVNTVGLSKLYYSWVQVRTVIHVAMHKEIKLAIF